MKKWFQICVHCGEYAWEYKQKPFVGMAISVANIIHKDNPKAGDIVICQNCKKQRPGTSKANLIEIEV